ncbi:MAG: hypothetical protein HY840_15800 [Bacteroidetes bacterium]|nr:hypothetical protein [Bacteroidota bacterium]
MKKYNLAIYELMTLYLNILFSHLSKFIPTITLISGLLFCSACRKDVGPIIVAPKNTQPISFTTEIQPIFTTNCAVAGCHNTTSQKANMDLTTGYSYGNLVNVTSNNYAPVLRVKPFSSDSSVLQHKVAHTFKYGGQMPPSGSLQSFELDNIKNWISQGAKNN